jgi:hypothetical protein
MSILPAINTIKHIDDNSYKMIKPTSLGHVCEFVCVSFSTGNLNCFRVK